MKYRSIFRAFMIVVGITSIIVIVLSQALPEISRSVAEKAKTEQTDQKTDLKILSAPSDVVPGGIIHLSDVNRSLLETFVNEEREVLEFRCNAHVLSGYFNVLFRSIISPNAP